MAFPVSPTEGQTYTENNTVWIYSSTAQQWFRSQVNPENETLYKFGSASATGSAGEIQYTDGTNLAASPNLVWDDVNDELEVGGDVVLDDGGTFTTTLQTITPTANRTVSLPNATGTVALVAGSSGQITYNNAGANAGVSSFTADSSGRLTNSASSAASLPVKLWNGTIFAGTTPHVLVQPSTASAGSWSASGTALGVNTAAAFGGNLLDLQVNGTSRFAVATNGVTSAPQFTSSGVGNDIFLSHSFATFKIEGGPALRVYRGAGDTMYFYAENASTFHIPGSLNFSATTTGNGSTGVVLARDANNTLAQRNGTNAQTFRVYNTFTDASNYERGFLRWSSNVFEVGPEAAGTGTARPMRITAATLKLPNLPTYADNAAATTGGLVAGDVYKTATGELRITV